jgi:hypothetical protein
LGILAPMSAPQPSTGGPAVWSVALPAGAEPPYMAFVNGVQQREGEDFTVDGRWLRFRSPLRVRPKLSSRQRIMLAIGIGVYADLTADVVDIQYRTGGEPGFATGLPVIPPQEPLERASTD